MNRKVIILSVLSLAVPCLGTVRAEGKSEKFDKESKQIRQEQTSDILDHLERGETVKKTFKPLKLESTRSVEYKLRVEKQAKEPVKCRADVTIGYLQFNTRVRVDTTVENKDCAASSGQYEIQLDIADTNHTRTIGHVEKWARDNNAPIESTKYYDIGDKVELIRATVRDVTCTCTPQGTE